MLDPATIERCIYWACKQEVSAPKPGNVNCYSGGHQMETDHFLESAHAIAPVLAQSGEGIGERILTAIKATRNVVDCNTNLGIVLLFAPLCQAVKHCNSFEQLADKLAEQLVQLSVNDAKYCYQAIRLAEPGGMGNSKKHDLAETPQVTLGDAMEEARTRDSIAAQYCNNFHHVFKLGLPSLKKQLNQGQTVEWATTFAYLIIVSHLPDTLICRKRGYEVAEKVSKQAGRFLVKASNGYFLHDFEAELILWDNELKRKKINPGTSADLTAATLLLYAFEQAFF